MNYYFANFNVIHSNLFTSPSINHAVYWYWKRAWNKIGQQPRRRRQRWRRRSSNIAKHLYLVKLKSNYLQPENIMGKLKYVKEMIFAIVNVNGMQSKIQPKHCQIENWRKKTHTHTLEIKLHDNRMKRKQHRNKDNDWSKFHG